MMKSMYGFVAIAVLCVGCASEPTEPAEPETMAPAQEPYADLAQLMRGIPFPNSNIVFDAQTSDPGAPPEETGAGGGATATFASVYGGWDAVRNAGYALQETANLMKVPGRLCANGRPVPLENEDFQMFIEDLVEAGAAAVTAAESDEWDEDTMFELGGTMADACAGCHEVYRDKADNADRCIP